MEMFQVTNRGILFKVKVIPKASKNEIKGWKEGELVVRLAAVPEKGEANDELIRFLASVLDIGKTNIEIIQGEKSRHKQVCVKGIPIAEIERKIYLAWPLKKNSI